MTTTMQLIAKQTVGANNATSIVFNNIPQTFTDLKIVASIRGTSSSYFTQSTRVTFNSSSSGYSTLVLQNTGNNIIASGANPYNVTSASVSTISGVNAQSTANTFSNSEIYIPNYAGSLNKSFSGDSVTETNSNGWYDIVSTVSAGLLSNTAAITSITLAPQTGEGDFAQYSTFYLYGISNSTTTQATTVPYASGGDVITTDGTYWYHTFLYSGTFTPLKNLTCDYLVVAGGGSGGSGSNGGGGGAGGLRSTVTATGGGGSLESALSLSANTTYAATVGAGGSTNTNGGNSVFASITSIGGGTGAPTGQAAGNGGSGGGAAYDSNLNGTGTTNQGYAGGTAVGSSSPYYGGSGGGGASAVGQNGTSSKGGDGGNGVAVSISGSSVTYAGGGGGATDGGTSGNGGTGGGGKGTSAGTNGTSGTPNTGGGGGADRNTIGLKGGSGIIIVRYAV